MMGQVVAFDIETLGLLDAVPLPEITCVCLYDGIQDIMLQLSGVDPTLREQNVQRLIAVMDAARLLVGFNAIYFDLEFIRQSLCIDAARMLRWQLKCLDPYACLRLVLGTGCKLQHLLTLNDMGAKTGSGEDAIMLAQTGQWDQLLRYCAMDARLTYRLVMEREWIRVAPGIECRMLPPGHAPEFRCVSAPAVLPQRTDPLSAVLLPDD